MFTQPDASVGKPDAVPVRSPCTRRSWAALIGTVLTLPAGIAAAAWLIDLQGYDPNNTEALPAGAALLAGGVATVIVLIAPVAAFLLGRRAVREGDDRGRVPMLVAAIGSVAFVALNFVPFALDLLFG